MKYILYVFLIFWGICISSSDIAWATILTPAGITKETDSILKKIPDPVGKVWVKSYLTHLRDTLSTIQQSKKRTEETKLLKKEIITNATNFIADIKNKLYTFDISNSERDAIEKLVLSYQTELVAKIRYNIANYTKKDKKGSGDTHFTIKSNEIDVTIHVNPYKITTTQEDKNIEIDTKITITVIQKKIDDRFEIMLDGFIKVIDQDIYISLRDYNIVPPKTQEKNITQYIELIKEIRGKVYHQKMNKEYRTVFNEQSNSRELILNNIEPVLDILSRESLLTPIAKSWEYFILGMSSKAAKSLSRSFRWQESSIFYDFPVQLAAGIPLPVEINTDGKQIHISRLDSDMRFHGTISRDPENMILLNIDMSEVGISNPWILNIQKTPTSWRLSATKQDYVVNTTSNLTTTTASIKKWTKTLGTAKIDMTGINAWMYDISAIWEYTKYNWDNEDESTETENIAIRLWGNIREEFGQFMIAPPTITEEFNKTRYSSTSRDHTRESHIKTLATYIESFYIDHDAYPKTPVKGCTSSIKWSKYDYQLYSEYQDPQELSTGSCPRWYYYRSIRDTEWVSHYILATRVEQKSAANFDSSNISITTGEIEEIRKKIDSTGTQLSNNPNNWYYIVTSDTIENE
jgi:hypothetical protein